MIVQIFKRVKFHFEVKHEKCNINYLILSEKQNMIHS